MASANTIAALLVVLVAVVVSAQEELPSRPQFHRWVRECRKDSLVAKAKPLYAFKKSIAGLYDPKTRHAFRKTKLTYAKFEFATIRRPSEAEKCLLECLAEKQGLINGSQLQPTKIVNVMMAFGKKINDMHGRTRVNMTRLKRNTAKCIVGTHGSAKTCELGFRLYHCLRAAIMESIYEDMTTTPAPTTSTPTTASWSTPARPEYRYAAGAPVYAATGAAAPPSPTPQRPDRFVAGAPVPPPPPPPPMMMAPPPPAMPVIPPPPGMTPSLVAYRQGSGMVEVFGSGPSPWRPRWRRGGMRARPRMMGPMI